MALPVPERIVVALIERLETITEANGYAFDVHQVVRVNRDGHNFAPFDRSIVVRQDPKQRVTDLDYPGNPPAVAYELPLVIKVWRLQDDRDSNADQTLVNEAEAQVEKAVCSENNWWVFDDCSFDASWGEYQYFRSEQGDHSGVEMPLLVRYRVSEYDPYEVR